MITAKLMEKCFLDAFWGTMAKHLEKCIGNWKTFSWTISEWNRHVKCLKNHTSAYLSPHRLFFCSNWPKKKCDSSVTWSKKSENHSHHPEVIIYSALQKYRYSKNWFLSSRTPDNSLLNNTCHTSSLTFLFDLYLHVNIWTLFWKHKTIEAEVNLIENH